MNGENENKKIIEIDCSECDNWVKKTDKQSAHCARGLEHKKNKDGCFIPRWGVTETPIDGKQSKN